MTQKITFKIFAASCIGIGLYPCIYFIIDRKFGLLSNKTPELLADILWNTAFYGHIIFGGISLLIGWTQFNTWIRKTKMHLHRRIGKVYLTTASISGACSIYLGFLATGGIISISGFVSLGIVWVTTTWTAFLAIRNKDIKRHEQLMIYSFAACFAAVTLRIWLPILTAAFGGFMTAYQVVAWVCWVPNLIVAYIIIQKKSSELRSEVV